MCKHRCCLYHVHSVDNSTVESLLAEIIADLLERSGNLLIYQAEIFIERVYNLMEALICHVIFIFYYSRVCRRLYTVADFTARYRLISFIVLLE